MTRKADFDHYTLPEKISDAFTGVEFQPRAENHYEKNDGVPVAPPVAINRPTIRQRIENLLNRGVDPLAHYVGSEGIDMDVPDDPDAPLTPSEQNFLDVVASDIAEAAPLPDEGMPRQEQLPPSPPPAASSEAAPAASGAPGGGGPAAPVPTR